jgi:cold shock CspA family protein
MENVKRIVGVVKWFSDVKGYGYITFIDENGNHVDFFAHHKNIISNHKFKKLKEGWTVSFEPTENEKGKLAKDIRLISINDDYQIEVMKKFFNKEGN